MRRRPQEDLRGDDVGARLAGDVAHRVVPGVRVVGRRREQDLEPVLIEREPGQGHVQLPADQAAHPPESGVDGLEARAVAHPPHQPLVVGRHELSVVTAKHPVGPVDEQRVVERAARALVDPHREPDAIALGDLAQPVARRARHLNRLAHQARERRPGGGVGPGRQEAHPAVRRVAGDEGLGEEHELGAGRGRLSRERVEALERPVAIEDRRLGLDARDGDGAPHDGEPTGPWPPTGVRGWRWARASSCRNRPRTPAPTPGARPSSASIS